MRLIRSVADLQNKRVLLRADFDVPVVNNKIIDSFRIEKQKENLQYLIQHGARVGIIAHASDISSFGPVVGQLGQILGIDINFVKNLEDFRNIPSVALLENIRSFPGETSNDDALAKNLAAGFDMYVNNAFSVCHRNHASVAAITKYVSGYVGLLLDEEIANLQKAVTAPPEGKVVIIGGAKIETKIPVINNFMGKTQAILTGGVVGNEIRDKSMATHPEVARPIDDVISEGKRLDIGPRTAGLYAKIISQANMVIWNGPMGLFEDERFFHGTRIVAEAIADSNAWTIIGGEDTISAVKKSGINLNKFKFVSTGVGAMLEFLSGKQLPGITALQ